MTKIRGNSCPSTVRSAVCSESSPIHSLAVKILSVCKLAVPLGDWVAGHQDAMKKKECLPTESIS